VSVSPISFDGKEAPRYYHQAAHAQGKELVQ
jgi:hypothetical protein